MEYRFEYDEYEDEERQKYVNLCAAVVLRALADSTATESTYQSQAHTIREARSWLGLHGAAFTDDPWSFEWCCQVIGVEAEHVRALAREYILQRKVFQWR